jgi:four helix bundle protein
MNVDEFKRRTKQFAVHIIQTVQRLPKSEVARIIGNQLLRAGTSVGSNYRSACRAKSCPDFIAKMKIVEEESDEALYWMELLVDTGQIKYAALSSLMKEAGEILSMTVASIKTARLR